MRRRLWRRRLWRRRRRGEEGAAKGEKEKAKPAEKGAKGSEKGGSRKGDKAEELAAVEEKKDNGKAKKEKEEKGRGKKEALPQGVSAWEVKAQASWDAKQAEWDAAQPAQAPEWSVETWNDPQAARPEWDTDEVPAWGGEELWDMPAGFGPSPGDMSAGLDDWSMFTLGDLKDAEKAVESGVSLDDYVKQVQEAKDNDLGGSFAFADEEEDEDVTFGKGFGRFARAAVPAEDDFSAFSSKPK